MTQTEVIALAAEAGFLTGVMGQQKLPWVIQAGSGASILVELQRFAELVAQRERDACAEVADQGHNFNYSGQDVAFAIRRRASL